MARTQQEMTDLIEDATNLVADLVVEKIRDQVPRWRRWLIDFDGVRTDTKIRVLTSILTVARANPTAGVRLAEVIVEQAKNERRQR